MRAAGLLGASRRRGTIVTRRRDKEARPAPDSVGRDFTAFRPNQLWVADITFVPTASGTGVGWRLGILQAFPKNLRAAML